VLKQLQQRAAFVTATQPSLEGSDKLAVDKVNPLHLPYEHHPYAEDLNAGKNLAPAGTYNWEDLPYPYNTYRVKVDPADVENPGLVWKLFSDVRTAVPMGGLLSLPLFYHGVIQINEVFELSVITLSTMVMLRNALGDTVKNFLADTRNEIKEELLTAEKEYNAALDDCLNVHGKAQHVASYVKALNDGERALRAMEAAAQTRALKIEHRNRTVAMLDYLVMLRESQEAELRTRVADASRDAVQKAFASDKALQAKSIDLAIEALGKGERAAGDDSVEALFITEMKKAATSEAAKIEAEIAASKAEEATVFRKRFGVVETEVTEAMLSKASGDAAAMAALKARCGGVTPAVGTPITAKLPIDF
jgi:hypothetical protein